MIKNIVIFIALLTTLTVAQTLHFRGTVKIDTLIATEIQTDTTGLLAANFFTGTDSIHYGEDSIVVTHGVGSTPQFVSIQLTSNSFGYPIWVNTIGATTFAVKRSDVGLEAITTYIKFKWMAYK